MGKLMKQSKKYADSELHFLTALDINPKYAVCMLEITHLYLVMKNQMEAKKYYQKAREISPDISCEDLDRVLK
jgi:tetratricopeptide (TPR) repeat protein